MTHTALKMARDALARPTAWQCELMQEDGSVRTMFVTEDPAGLRFNDMGEPSPFRVTPLYALDALQSTHPADASKVVAQIDMRDSVPSAEPRTLTDAQIERHTFAAGECPPNSQVILVSSIRRLLGYTGTPTAPAPAQAEVTTGSIPAPMTEADEARLKVALGGVFGWATCPTTAATHAANGTAIAGGRPAPAQAEPVAHVGDLIIQVRERVTAGGFKTSDPLYATPPAAAAPLAQPLTEARILEMAAEAETPAWGEWYTDEDALFKFARAVEAHKGQP